MEATVGEQNNEKGSDMSKFLLQVSLGMSTIFEDPVSFEIMEDAVITSCGHSFSASTIKNWFENLKKESCPICNKQLKPDQVMPNYKLREAIASYKKVQDERLQDHKKNTNTFSIYNQTSSVSTPTSPDHSMLNLPISNARFSISGPPKKVLIDEDDGNISDDDEIGNEIDSEEDPKLIVDVVRATDLMNKSSWGVSSPFVTIDFLNERKQTRILKNNLSPVWNESFVFNVPRDVNTHQVLVTIWDKERIIGSSFLGHVSKSIKDIKDARRICDVFALQKRSPKSSIKGSIKLRFFYIDPTSSYFRGGSRDSITPQPKQIPKQDRTKSLPYDVTTEKSRDLRAEIASLHLASPPPVLQRSGRSPSQPPPVTTTSSIVPPLPIPSSNTPRNAPPYTHRLQLSNNFVQMATSAPSLPTVPTRPPTNQPPPRPPKPPKMMIQVPTVVCRYFLQGTCRFENDCAHLHERNLPQQVIPKMELVNLLTSMGFQKQIVEYVLKRCRNHLPTATTVLLTNYEKIQAEYSIYDGVV